MGPGEEEDFRLVTVDGNTTIQGTDQNKGVVFILREREKEGGGGQEAGKVVLNAPVTTYTLTVFKFISI